MKKALLIGLFLALVAVLVAGGAYRTLDRTGNLAEARGLGQGEGGHGRGNGLGGNGYGDGSGAEVARADAAGWRTVEGTVVSADSSALTVETTSGEQVIVEGQPYRFARSLGFTVRLGERLTLTGFDEGGEFKAGRITHPGTGQTYVLRDDSGRPMWSGRGRGGG